MHTRMNAKMPKNGLVGRKSQVLLWGLGLLLCAQVPVIAQSSDDDLDEDSVPIVGAGSAQSEGANELKAALIRLAANPRDISALVAAGNAALELGDDNAAVGFFVRAAQLEPSNGQVKAGLASALVYRENPYDALKLFEEAAALGVPERQFAADRALAFDLVGDNASAQRQYQLALQGDANDDVVRRYAMSLAISGQKAAAESQLLPLLRKQDSAAWRTRAFVYAVSGEEDEAVSIAYATMPRDMAGSMAPYLRYMRRLTRAQQAAAAEFGHFPRSADIGRDDPRNAKFAQNASSPLIPAGEPLGSEAGKKKEKPSREKRRRPGKNIETAIASAPPVAPQITPQPKASDPAPILPPDRKLADATPSDASSNGATSPRSGNRPAVSAIEQSRAPLPNSQAVADRTSTPTAANRQQDPSRGSDSLPTAQSTPLNERTQATTTDALPAPESAATDMVPTTVATSKGTAAIPGFDSLGSGTPPAQPDPSVAANGTAVAAAGVVPPTGDQDGQGEGTANPFDLASMAGEKTGPAANASLSAVAAEPIVQEVPRSFNDIMGTISVPADQLARNDDAVDITSFEAPRPRPEPKVEPKAEPKKEKPKPPAHPSRHWVQVAGGANVDTLPREWKRLKGIAADAFKGKDAYSTPLRFTNRLLTGPFDTDGAAQDFVNVLAKAGISAFTFTSAEGQEIKPLNVK